MDGRHGSLSGPGAVCLYRYLFMLRASDGDTHFSDRFSKSPSRKSTR